MEREATSSSPMLTATEARKASVQGTFLKPSTKRSEVVKPTSKKPPTMSQSQGMKILSLDERRALVTLACHGEAVDYRQQNRAAAVPCVPCDARHRVPGRLQPARQLGASGNDRIRRGCDPVPDLLRAATRHTRGARDPRTCRGERCEPRPVAGHYRDCDGDPADRDQRRSGG